MSSPAEGGERRLVGGNVSLGLQDKEVLQKPAEEEHTDPGAELQIQRKKPAPRGLILTVFWVLTVALLVSHVLAVWRLLAAAASAEMSDTKQNAETLLQAGLDSVSGTAGGNLGLTNRWPSPHKV
ncbi:hypothetical protein ACSSS7_003852 [Eimeria intestinalis]